MITEKNAREVDSDIRQSRQLVDHLPWIIAVGGLVVYLATLSHWVTPNSLPHVAKVSGWTWQPELYGPLYFLLTLPFRWLPGTAIPLALNVFAAVCAALTLALLARSVALLPHDRTHEQRVRETSDNSLLTTPMRWLPPVLAVIVCGLQLSFWENATAASNEILDLLLFAYVIRNLLEYRRDQNESWLLRAALVYGLAIPNNWAMLGFFPVFFVALIWIKRLGFFDLRFLGLMAVCGLVGLTVYLLLPLTEMRGKFVQVPFWDALRANIRWQKAAMSMLLNNDVIFHGDHPLWVLSLFALVPLLLIAIRWPSYFGDTSRVGVGIATSILNVLYGVFLLVCIWVAFDPRTSPRNYRVGLPALLTFYYLGGLCVGYFTGYFLLVFGTLPARTRRVSSLVRAINRAVVGIIWILFFFTPAVLLYRNVEQIRFTNGGVFQRFAAAMRESLPSTGAVVLSDDPRRTMSLKAALIGNPEAAKYLVIETSSLKWPQYHKFLKSRYGSAWPSDPPKSSRKLFTENEQLDLLAQLATTNSVFYLHPSFGYYFEWFYLQPHRLAYQLLSYPTNTLLLPTVSKEVTEENETFWTRSKNEDLKAVRKILHSGDSQSGPIGYLMMRAHLDPIVNREATMLGGLYSRSLDYWGVEMQKQNRFTEAANHFETALDLNADNVVAQVNLEYNKNLQAGRRSPATIHKSIEDQFGKYRNWDEVMSENGPFDEPNFCFEEGRLHARFKLYRQAAAQFERAMELAPDHLSARLWMTQMYLLANRPDDAIALINEIHLHPQSFTIHKTNRTEVLFAETSAYLVKNDVEAARKAVESALEKYPDDDELLGTATHVYMNYGQFSNALAIIERQLKLTPQDPSLFVNRGYAFIQLKAFDEAIASLSKGLTLQPSNSSALLNRAIAYLRAGKYAEAKSDYEALQKLFPTAFQIYYGLGEIAYNNKDTNAAIRNYQLYLKNGPPDGEETKFVSSRLQELKGSSP
jgi:tetratricopeptide (TPR) repeat protein